MEISIIKGIQSIANSFLDVFFWIITKMGEEVFFLLLFAGIYLLYSKNFAYRYAFNYFVSVCVSTLVKMIVKRPRPYTVSTDIKNRLPETDYCFPSGHTQHFVVQSTTLMQEIGKSKSKKSFKVSMLVIFILLSIMMMISRMYWGQHYISDTIVGLMVGLAIPFIIEWLFVICPKKLKEIFTLDLICKCIVAIGVVGYGVCLYISLSKDLDAMGITTLFRQICIFLSTYTSVSLGYLIDKKFIHYDEKSTKATFFLKAIIVYATLIVLYLLCNLIFNVSGIGYFYLYFFLGLVTSIALPLLLKVVFKRKGEIVDINNENVITNNSDAETQTQMKGNSEKREEKIDGNSNNK